MAARASLSKTFVWIILALLILGLAGFGATNLSGTIRTVGHVGDKYIDVEDYARSLQQEIRAAEFETRNAYRGVMTDIAQVRALGKSLESTEVAVEAEEAGFEVGTRTIVDVLDATRENFLARLNYARARYLYVVDQLRLKRAAGILSRQDMIEVNDALAPIRSGP